MGIFRFISLFVFFIVLSLAGFVLAEEADDLRSLIDNKSVELDEILERREALGGELDEINATQSVLRRDIGKIDYNVRQLNLSIEANRVSIDKLGLEVDSLDRDTRIIKSQIDSQKDTIAKLLLELYQRDKDDLLVLLLRYANLAESVSAVQSIMVLNGDLTIGVEELRGFQKELAQKSVYAQQKKVDQERERVNLQNRQYIIQDQKTQKQVLLRETKNQEVVYEGQIAELDRQQDEISLVIEEFEHKLRESFDPSLLPLKRPGVLGYPVRNIVVTQKYGATAFAKRAYRTKFHIGTDFSAGVGTPLYASEDGKIVAVGDNGKLQFGRYLAIEYENNLTSLYAHLSRQIVSVGETVRRGDVIGYSGNTGYTTGPHLHFGVYWSKSFQLKKFPGVSDLVPVGVHIDPQDYL